MGIERFTSHSQGWRLRIQAMRLLYKYIFVFSLPIPLVIIERIYTLSCYHHQIGSMNCHPLFGVRSWNNGVRFMSLFILMNLWYGQIAWRDNRVWWYLPRSWPSVTDMQHYYHASYRTDDWHLAYTYSLVYFSVEVCLEGVFPHYDGV